MKIATIKRSNGKVEKVDITDKIKVVNHAVFEAAKKANAANGDKLLSIEVITKLNNIGELQNNWNKLHNEGAEGYVPDEDYLKSTSEYKEWESVTVYE